MYRVEGSASTARVAQGQQGEAGWCSVVGQKGCQLRWVRVEELEEAAEEMAMVELITSGCRSWQRSLHPE